MHRLKGLLVGEMCESLECQAGYLGVRLEDRGLWVGSAWRVLHDGRLVAGSDSQEAAKAGLVELLVGQRIKSVALRGSLNDLMIEFGNGVRVETFANAEEYEHWHMAGGPDEMIIAGPGTSWSAFQEVRRGRRRP